MNLTCRVPRHHPSHSFLLRIYAVRHVETTVPLQNCDAGLKSRPSFWFFVQRNWIEPKLQNKVQNPFFNCGTPIKFKFWEEGMIKVGDQTCLSLFFFIFYETTKKDSSLLLCYVSVCFHLWSNLEIIYALFHLLWLKRKLPRAACPVQESKWIPNTSK